MTNKSSSVGVFVNHERLFIAGVTIGYSFPASDGVARRAARAYASMIVNDAARLRGQSVAFSLLQRVIPTTSLAGKSSISILFRAKQKEKLSPCDTSRMAISFREYAGNSQLEMKMVTVYSSAH